MARITITQYQCDKCKRTLSENLKGLELGASTQIVGANNRPLFLSVSEVPTHVICAECLMNSLGVEPKVKVVTEVVTQYVERSSGRSSGGASGRPLLQHNEPVLAPLIKSVNWTK
jgi:hypothetical protein